ncbi:MAG: prepilin-type N-terminal cleavage/methylation domain-containing protein [Candidatus Buchananbacteria bacterium]
MFKSSNKKGFSIIEAVVAVSILLIGILAVTQFFPFSQKIIGDSQSLSTASDLAMAKIEEIQAEPYDSIDIGTIEAKHRLAATTTDYLYNYQRKSEVAYVDNNLAETQTDHGFKKITVTVFWPSPIGSREKSIILRSMVTDF